MLGRWNPTVLRAALWTWCTLRALRREPAGAGLYSLRVASPPSLPEGAVRGVWAVLHRTGATCLEGALVRQAWEADHGRPRAVVVGVRHPRHGGLAHAWLEGEEATGGRHGPGAYGEVLRLAP